MEDRLLVGSKKLEALVCGDTVVVQNQAAKKMGKPGKWTKTGEVVEVLPFDSYLVLLHGSRAPTQRNRRFLKKITPLLSQFPKALPPPSPPTTRAATRAAARASTTSKT